MGKVEKALKLNIAKKFYISDSMMAMHYIRSNANTWQVFIANRVAKVQRKSDPADWYHIETNLNPADLVSRGVFCKELSRSKTYWHGPDF